MEMYFLDFYLKFSRFTCNVSTPQFSNETFYGVSKFKKSTKSKRKH